MGRNSRQISELPELLVLYISDFGECHYPLVNIQKTMERSTIFHGKIHYFYGHFQ